MDPSSVDWWPSGPLGTFLLFLLPIGPSKTAGILLGKNAGLGPAALLGLYAAKEIVAAAYVEPLLRLAGRFGGRRAWSAKLGEQIAALADRAQLGSSRWARLTSLALVSLGAGLLTGAVALHHTPISRPLGWLGVVAGDVVWFSFLLAAALGLATFVPDDRLVFVAVCLLTMLGGPAARRLRPLARNVAPAEAAVD